jgi:hypothetical protein
MLRRIQKGQIGKVGKGYAPTAESRMIMSEIKDYPPYLDYPKPYKPQTNGDRIRAMSDEELARHLHCIGWDCHLCAEHKRLDNEPLLRDQRCDENCFEHCLEWLKQPAE